MLNNFVNIYVGIQPWLTFHIHAAGMLYKKVLDVYGTVLTVNTEVQIITINCSTKVSPMKLIDKKIKIKKKQQYNMSRFNAFPIIIAL